MFLRFRIERAWRLKDAQATYALRLRGKFRSPQNQAIAYPDRK